MIPRPSFISFSEHPSGLVYDANTHNNPDCHYTLFPTRNMTVTELTQAVVYLSAWEQAMARPLQISMRRDFPKDGHSHSPRGARPRFVHEERYSPVENSTQSPVFPFYPSTHAEPHSSQTIPTPVPFLKHLWLERFVRTARVPVRIIS